MCSSDLRDQPVIPGVAFIRYATAFPLRHVGSLAPTFVPARPVCLAVKQVSALARPSRLPSGLNLPLRASVTFWEATAPVKLPTSHRPLARFMVKGEAHICRRVVFHRRLHQTRKSGFPGSHLSYAAPHTRRWQAVVKLHGVFLSCCE